MKKVSLIYIALFAACLLQACHGRNDSEADDDTTTAIADTSNNATIIVGKDDARFVTDVSQACMAIIKAGNLAKKQGKDKRVRNFGALMVKDLTKGKKRLDSLAKIKKIALPDSISIEQSASLSVLAKKTGKDFDKAYLDKMTADYKKALQLFQSTAKTAYDPQIKAFAAKNIMTVQRHLDLVQAIDGSLK